MIWMKRVASAALMIVGSLAISGVAQAAPPPNDVATGATAVTGLPFVDVVDTTEATTTQDEVDFNQYCGAPVIEHGVWYTSTPTTSGFATIDTTGSDYSTGILVVAGTPGNFTPLACQQGSVSGPFTAGETRYFMVFGDGLSPTTSGTMRLEVRAAVAPPVLELTLDPVAKVDRDGAATITGTVTCTATDGQGVVFGVDGSVRQRVGRGFVDGFFFTTLDIPCDGSTGAWSALAVADGGKFAGGKAATVAFSFGCGTGGCSSGYVESTVQMKKGHVG